MSASRAIASAVAGRRAAALSLLLTGTAVIGFACTVIWAGTGFGSYWPAWVWFAGLVPISLFWILPEITEGLEGRRLRLAVHAGLSAWVASILVLIWAFSGGGTFWPLVTVVVLAALVVLHALLLRQVEEREEHELEERVVELTRTRRGALDVQAQELQRIERDLHDGAQARLVALSMQLGRAEERLGDRPEDRELIRAARAEAGAAIAELRDLARGIAPPVLADRGLAAALEALAGRSAIPVDVDVAAGERLAPAIESVAYFVVAESLTNAAKHAGRGARATVAVARDAEVLRVVVADDGTGGADPAGSGLSGLRNRVEAVDGKLVIESPAEVGTTVTVELPCE
ncbi:MAG TPA: histidine kinase [Solirubrobacterales bacterium]|nr:histidine kinase [Solirubrobacterales bacterium]